MTQRNYTIQSAITFIFISYLFGMLTFNFGIIATLEALMSGGCLVFGLYLLKNQSKTLQIAFYLSIFRWIIIVFDIVRPFIMPMELPTYILIFNMVIYVALTFMVTNETTKICQNVKSIYLDSLFIFIFIGGFLFQGNDIHPLIWIVFLILIVCFLEGLSRMRKAPAAKQNIQLSNKFSFVAIFYGTTLITLVACFVVHYFWPIFAYENYTYKVDMQNKELVYTINDFESFWDTAKMYHDKKDKESYVLHLHKDNTKGYTLLDMRFDFPQELFAAHVYPRVYDGKNVYKTSEEIQYVNDNFGLFGDTSRTIYRTYCNPNVRDLDVYLEFYFAPRSDDDKPLIDIEDFEFYMSWSAYTRNDFNYNIDATQYGGRITTKKGQ